MPRRSDVGLRDVASLDNLLVAYRRAVRGKRHRAAVQRFESRLEARLACMHREILSGSCPVGVMRRFVVHDPKRRVIHAPAFRERVLHHALMRCMEPVLERAHVDWTYACRPAKGALMAVQAAQRHLRAGGWVVKVDVRRYFDSIRHDHLQALLARRFGNRGLLDLCRRIVGAYEVAPGRGLPIGALTSQHFANLYLGPLDRYLKEILRVRAAVRYMDDLLWWTHSRAQARATLASARTFVSERLGLVLKPDAQVHAASKGVPFCGFRVQRDRLLLSRRRRRRYAAGRRLLEQAFCAERIGALDLQRGFAAVQSITAHADSLGWRRAELARNGVVDS